MNHCKPIRYQFDAAYIQALRNGSSETIEHFFQYFSSVLRISLRKHATAAELVDDIRQETFLRVLQTLKKPGGIRSPERFGAFIVAVCNNVRREFLRSTHRLCPHDDAWPDGAPDPETESMRQELRKKVRHTLSSLSTRDQRLLMMSLAEDCPHADISEALHAKPSNLPVLLYRAKIRFRREFENKPPESCKKAGTRSHHLLKKTSAASH